MTTRKILLRIRESYGWTSSSPRQFAEKCKVAAEDIKAIRKDHPFNALAFTGSSGSAMAYILSVTLNIPVIYVRKKDESTHGKQVESNTRTTISKYLIIDDFVCTGDTIRNIINGINKFSDNNNYKRPVPIGVYLYAEKQLKTVSCKNLTLNVFPQQYSKKTSNPSKHVI